MSAHFACTLGLSAGLLCLPATLDAADPELEARGKVSFKKNAVAATPSKPLARARSTELHRCATCTPGLIHESCRRSCPKGRFPSTRKCRRSTFPTRMCMQSFLISMLLRLGNEIGASYQPHSNHSGPSRPAGDHLLRRLCGRCNRSGGTRCAASRWRSSKGLTQA